MTVKEIANLCGVSVATVSRVFNEPEKVKPETRERILEIAKKYGYMPHAIAKSLRTKRTGVYSLTVMSGVERVFEDSYVSKFLRGAVRYFSSKGLKLIIDVFTKGDIKSYYKTLVSSKLVDGYILMDIKDDDIRVELLNELGVPFVCVGRNNKNNFIYVDTDNYTGGRQAGEHLKEIGCTNVLFIGGDASLPFEKERFRGFVDGLSGFGGKVYKAFANYDEKNVQNIVEKYLNEIDGIFCTSDVMAYAALRVCEQKNIDIPLIGFDNILLSEIANITTIDQNIHLVGEKVAHKVHQLVLGEQVESEVISTHLVVRGTKKFLNSTKGGRFV
ncbi:LacI family DNA-binding transcriptional regulator [Fervidobacterium pennivorans subsp. shakshaketiis]|jgi:DNA-binding LacI/PurR family transcriptional regulator|uniref:Transcriptional regulator n=1 Tax=Fervidobacterium pennivorans (strain DSM 9078 / Ven5) TaxID=771875 RepID=H9UDR8_FERPD|nr:LacI family DNA-binding transcriptional regulator [Fervidobacterium pennivorans]AFG35661.1 transcriptional regulator [Fervidobacterium pennivorans DSM 9078]QIV78731.1 LacI family transcriptional regulator [Fervidobacterium pennivorans subsp. keratinolyticus]